MPGIFAEPIAYPVNVGTMCTAEEGRTRQSDAQAADINFTIRKYNLQPLELEPGWSGRAGAFLDISDMPDYQSALNMVRVAEEAFMELPPAIRDKFDNSHVVMLDAWDKGTHQDVFEEIGYLERKPAERPAVVPVAEPAVEGQRRTADGRYTTDKPPIGGAE